MIIGYYEGLHFLDLLPSFENTAWGAQYGAWTQAQEDPLFSSLSNFKIECYTKGIRLEYAATWTRGKDLWRQTWEIAEKNQIPVLFVISGYSKEMPLNSILARVETGSNLVIIYSPLTHSLYRNECEELLDTLELQENQLAQYAKQQKTEKYGQGRIFYLNSDEEISDGKIERGPFGGKADVDVAKAKEQLASSIDRISVFSVPFVDCLVRSVPLSWPKDEILIVEIEVKNRSTVDIPSVVIDISFSPEFEPVSNKVVEIERFKAGSTRSITTLVVPRVKGEFDNPIQITSTYHEINQPVYLPASRIQILDNLQNLLRESSPQQVDVVRMLPKYEQYLKPIASSDVILQLLNVDPDSVVSKTRRIGEHIAKAIAHKTVKEYDSSWTFATITKRLHNHHVISSKAKGYIDTIRVFGNMAAHADRRSAVAFSREDALVVLHALLLFLKEVVEANLLLAKKSA